MFGDGIDHFRITRLLSVTEVEHGEGGEERHSVFALPIETLHYQDGFTGNLDQIRMRSIDPGSPSQL